MKGKGEEKSIERVGTQDRPSKVQIASAVPAQVRKTIDRISTRTRKRIEKSDFIRGCLELSVWCTLPLPPQSSFLELFEKKL